MRKFFALLILAIFLFANSNYSEMSTQELMAMLGFVVDKKDETKLLKELDSRLSSMTKEQKSKYLEYIKKHSYSQKYKVR
jgi:hypothetical protein